MFVDFKDLVQDTENTVKEVLKFVGVEEDRYVHKPLPAGKQLPPRTLSQVTFSIQPPSSHDNLPTCVTQSPLSINN
jgi:hypothetical protein